MNLIKSNTNSTTMKDFIVLMKIGMLEFFLNILGEGAYSEVYKVKRKTD
jgi:hypothetical protein